MSGAISDTSISLVICAIGHLLAALFQVTHLLVLVQVQIEYLTNASYLIG